MGGSRFAATASLLLIASLVAAAPSSDPDDRPQPALKETKEKERKQLRTLPIPIFITEPALGYGLGAAVAYFHRQPAKPESTSLAPALTASASEDAARPQQSPPPGRRTDRSSPVPVTSARGAATRSVTPGWAPTSTSS